MKKIIALLIAVMMMVSCCSFAMAEEDSIKMASWLRLPPTVGLAALPTSQSWPLRRPALSTYT